MGLEFQEIESLFLVMLLGMVIALALLSVGLLVRRVILKTSVSPVTDVLEVKSAVRRYRSRRAALDNPNFTDWSDVTIDPKTKTLSVTRGRCGESCSVSPVYAEDGSMGYSLHGLWNVSLKGVNYTLFSDLVECINHYMGWAKDIFWVERVLKDRDKVLSIIRHWYPSNTYYMFMVRLSRINSIILSTRVPNPSGYSILETKDSYNCDMLETRYHDAKWRKVSRLTRARDYD